MIVLLAAAALSTAAPAQSRGCPDLITPEALICRAIEAQANGNSQAAAQAFEQAAIASSEKDPGTARLYAAAGNMWIAADQPGKAAFDLDKALAVPGLEGEQRAEALLDRARAAEAQGDLKTARAKVTEAAASIPDDPFYWYFSAALAMREGDAANAQSAIAKALALAPSDPTVLFEAGHVAAFAGEESKARYYWERAAAADPKGPVGKSAREALAMTPVPATVVTEPRPAKPKSPHPKS